MICAKNMRESGISGPPWGGLRYTPLVKILKKMRVILIMQKQKILYPCQMKGLANEAQEKPLRIDRFLG